MADTAALDRRCRVGLVQLCSGADVAINLAATAAAVDTAVAQGAEVVMVPEGFACLGTAAERIAIAESLDDEGPILAACRALARRHRIHLLLGGFPEACDERRTWNTAVHLDPEGALLARYRKIHLFDVDLADGTRLTESASTAAGDQPVLTRFPFGRTGLSICYDLRFAALYETLVQGGARVLTAPSAFTASTGRDHWDVLLRARAIETQCWMLAPAQVGAHGGGRVSFGHSLAVDPWGRVVLDLGEEPGVGVVEIDPRIVDEVRRRLPSLRHRRMIRGITP
ncbi:MAG: carbon-nitrogen hydrolase family protein [Pseudomonadales bacterium]|jgi:predicted amidohydrolase|nr:carbon-nitrogen hydrolase family protein [Pseudomonadales bacterium]